jgi:hypothetical protein
MSPFSVDNFLPFDDTSSDFDDQFGLLESNNSS